MSIGSTWNELAAQQLVRYEALFKLLDNIQGLDDILLIARHVATQWKYFANVSSWRLVVFQEHGALAIDGLQGEARITESQTLSTWDSYHRSLQRPRAIRSEISSAEGPSPPEHLTGTQIAEIRVFPLMRAERWVALLSVAARHKAFSELDIKFVSIFGTHFADRISDILLRRQATEVLIQRATRDSLTGLYNRGAIIERLEEQLALAKRTGHPLSVILADIDFFKGINDRHGHLVGDEVLREVSLCLQTQMRKSDYLGRYGGEEFLFVLFPCHADEVAEAAVRFRLAIDGASIVSARNSSMQIDVSISLGTSSTSEQPDVNIDALLRQADDALYRSKAAGRNRVTQGGPEPFPNESGN